MKYHVTYYIAGHWAISESFECVEALVENLKQMHPNPNLEVRITFENLESNK